MTNPAPTHPAGQVDCRIPTPADAAGVRALVEACPPLDVNSTYAYLLLCSHFAQTCVLAEIDGEPAGFLSAYIKPTDPSTLFVWQVAVSPQARGRGVGSRMLDEAFARDASHGARYVEATISPGNAASWALFKTFAQKRGAACTSADQFRPEDFGPEAHEEERLLRIGPIQRASS
ncbi:MAG: diaminobutyrate acetyltransferase [Bryobacterales bacterium]|nr:diaminobutyrate acetyltransferase [Acidobacteriota bacterium]MCB9385496.1 diaminobutyrate acetyltransferase [Bryobacterales bacterium]